MSLPIASTAARPAVFCMQKRAAIGVAGGLRQVTRARNPGNAPPPG